MVVTTLGPELVETGQLGTSVVGATVVIRVGEVVRTTLLVEGHHIAIVGFTESVGVEFRALTTALQQFVVLQGRQVLQQLVTVVTDRVVEHLTAFFNGAGRERHPLVLVVAVADLLPVLLNTVFSVTLG